MSASRMSAGLPPRTIGSIARILVRDQATMLLAIGLFSLVLVNVMIQTRTMSGAPRPATAKEAVAARTADREAATRAAEAEIAAAVAPRPPQPLTPPAPAPSEISGTIALPDAIQPPTSEDLGGAPPQVAAAAPPVAAPAPVDPSRRRVVVGTFLRATPAIGGIKVVRVVPGEAVTMLGSSEMPDGSKWVEVQAEHGKGFLPGFAVEELVRDKEYTRLIFGVIGGVVDSATIEVAGRQVRLSGVVSIAGPWNDQFRDRMMREAPTVTCTMREEDRYRCITEDLVDISELLLLNGAARADAGAQASYVEREADAQKAKRGIWRR